jgi:hypothetical protein
LTNLHSSCPAGEVLRSASAASSTINHSPASSSRRHFADRLAVHAEPPVLRRHPHLVRYPDIKADFDILIDKAIAAIAEGEPVEDEILGHYVNVASLVRAVSFREGNAKRQTFFCIKRDVPIAGGFYIKLYLGWYDVARDGRNHQYEFQVGLKRR